MVSSLAGISEESREFRRRYLQTMNSLEVQHVPSQLQERVKQCLALNWEMTRGIDPNTTLSLLPSILRHDMLSHIGADFLRRNPLFPTVPIEALDLVLPLIRTSYVPANQFIYHIGDVAENMYYIIEGTVRLIRARPNQMATSSDEEGLEQQQQRLYWGSSLIQEQEFFGLPRCIDDKFCKREEAARADSPCHLLSVCIRDLSQVLQRTGFRKRRSQIM